MEILTVRQLLYWSYANLAMAHSALTNNQHSYIRINYMIRAKLYKGLCTGKMKMRTLFDDEKIKIAVGHHCMYCGSDDNISIDHIFPQKKGGQDDAGNLICVCKSCNSSKGSKDMVEWFAAQNSFPPLLVLRRYLKLVYIFCETNDLLDEQVSQVDDSNFPFQFQYIPTTFPELEHLSLLK